MRFYSGFLIFLNASDVFLTHLGIKAFGLHEGNAFGVWLLQYGISGLIIAKAISTAIILAIAWSLNKWHPKWANGALVYCCVLMSGVVVFNGISILRQF